jgi:hypothetical protein
MIELERRILAAVRDAKAEGLEPKSVYLTPEDLEQLDSSGALDQVGGLPVRRVGAKGKSTLYCRHGIARRIRGLSERPRP